jgi:hypothetical protein
MGPAGPWGPNLLGAVPNMGRFEKGFGSPVSPSPAIFRSFPPPAATVSRTRSAIDRAFHEGGAVGLDPALTDAEALRDRVICCSRNATRRAGDESALGVPDQTRAR